MQKKPSKKYLKNSSWAVTLSWRPLVKANTIAAAVPATGAFL